MIDLCDVIFSFFLIARTINGLVGSAGDYSKAKPSDRTPYLKFIEAGPFSIDSKSIYRWATYTFEIPPDPYPRFLLLLPLFSK